MPYVTQAFKEVRHCVYGFQGISEKMPLRSICPTGGQSQQDASQAVLHKGKGIREEHTTLELTTIGP